MEQNSLSYLSEQNFFRSLSTSIKTDHHELIKKHISVVFPCKYSKEPKLFFQKSCRMDGFTRNLLSKGVILRLPGYLCLHYKHRNKFIFLTKAVKKGIWTLKFTFPFSFLFLSLSIFLYTLAFLIVFRYSTPLTYIFASKN